jgi:Ca-activated chloride channel homolog
MQTESYSQPLPITRFYLRCSMAFLFAIQAAFPIHGQPSATPSNQRENSQYLIRADVDLVVLNATVMDKAKHFVPDLIKANFRVFEDGVEQKISMFSHEDIPVTMGLVIDNSGSMREKRDQVNAAAISFVKTSNPEDEVFVVNFNQEIYLDSVDDFTSDVGKLKEALSRIDSRGGTALYDAVDASLDHIRKGQKDKKILLVITDGDDDASKISLNHMMQVAIESDVTVYAIGIFSREDRLNDRTMVRRSKKTLTMLARATGGAAYFPDHLSDVETICTQVAYDIRSQYTIGYYPSKPATDGKYRTVRVQLKQPKGTEKFTVNTRSGYYPKKTS